MIADLNILELIKFIYSAFKDKNTKIHRWRPMLELYEKLNQVIAGSENLIDFKFEIYLNDRDFYSERWKGLEGQSYLHAIELGIPEETARSLYGTAETAWAKEINKRFITVDSLMNELTRCLEKVHTAIEIHDTILFQKIEYHLRFKSTWLIIFNNNFTVGKIVGNNTRLTSRSIKINEEIDSIIRSPFSEDFVKSLLIENSVDITNKDEVSIFFTRGKENIAAFKKIRDEIKDLIKENCTMDDLLQ